MAAVIHAVEIFPTKRHDLIGDLLMPTDRKPETADGWFQRLSDQNDTQEQLLHETNARLSEMDSRVVAALKGLDARVDNLESTRDRYVPSMTDMVLDHEKQIRSLLADRTRQAGVIAGVSFALSIVGAYLATVGIHLPNWPGVKP